jgi:hypothetical protein
MPKKIGFFEGEWGFLSNFSLSPIVVEGISIDTVEHAYQCKKTTNKEVRVAIYLASSPGQAKKMGNRIDLRHDWDEIKVDVMRDLLFKKFEHPQLRMKLLATGDAYLEEGNYWGDRIWGVVNGRGKNLLGKLLMEVRDSISKGIGRLEEEVI